MNANKQDAGGEVTNPDNVGGLLPCPFCGGEAELVGGEQDEFCHWHVQCTVCGAISGESLSTSTPDRDFASESWNRRELCRAAPAGSGEVEEYDWDAAHEALESIDDYARMDVGVAPHGPYTVLRDLLTKAKGWQEAAALLRKLQQGAE